MLLWSNRLERIHLQFSVCVLLLCVLAPLHVYWTVRLPLNWRYVKLSSLAIMTHWAQFNFSASKEKGRREGGKPSITTTGIDETDDIRDGLEMKIGRALYYICSAAAVYHKSRNIRQSEICSRNLHLMFDRPWKRYEFLWTRNGWETCYYWVSEDHIFARAYWSPVMYESSKWRAWMNICCPNKYVGTSRLLSESCDFQVLTKSWG